MSADAKGHVHVPALDGIRGTAILMVMLLHLWCMPQATTVDRFFFLATNLGVFGPDLFFVLSGYLITGILLDAKGSAHYFRNFYMRRIFRIFPLYYAILIVALYVLPAVLPPDKAARFGSIAGDEPYYWLYLSNFSTARAGLPRHGVLDVTWSLAIEEQFYLFWPAVVGYLSRRHLVRLALVGAACALLTRTGVYLFSGYNNYSIFMLTTSHLDSLLMGAGAACLAREAGGLARYRARARTATFVCLPFVIGIPIAEAVFGPPNPFGVGLGAVCVCIGYSFVAVCFAATLVLAVTSTKESLLSRVFTSSFLQMLGKYSYGLYLVHLPIRAVIRDRIFGPSHLPARFHFPRLFGSELPGQLAFYVIAGGASLVVALLSFHLFEQQFLKLKRFFPSGAERLRGAGSLAKVGDDARARSVVDQP